MKIRELEDLQILENVKREDPLICQICFNEIGMNDIKFSLPCGKVDDAHVFHKDCLKKWQISCAEEDTEFTCPYCREELGDLLLDWIIMSNILIYMENIFIF